MQVIFLTEGGSLTGLGHIMRCVSLQQAFEEKGINSKFFINGDVSITNLKLDIDLEIIDWTTNKNKIKPFLKKENIVIIDSYLASFDIYKEISNTVNIPVYVDDYNRFEFPQGIVLNGSISAEHLNYPRNDKIKYLLGTAYQPIRKAFWEVPQKTISEKIGNILITFGGNDLRNLTPKILKFLRHPISNVRKHVIIGQGFKNLNLIEESRDQNTMIYFSPKIEDIKSLMLDSDLAISSAGQTLYELARVGVPTLAIKIINNQSTNLMGWEKTNFILDMGDWSKISQDSVIKHYKSLQSRELRMKKSNIGRLTIDGQGSRRVVNYLLS